MQEYLPLVIFDNPFITVIQFAYLMSRLNKIPNPQFSFRLRPRIITALKEGKRIPQKQQKEIYRRYMESPEWATVRAKYKKDACEICAADKRLTLHHLTYKNLLREGVDDLATLCWDCHKTAHIAVKSEDRLLYPSGSLHRLVRRIRENRQLKREHFCTFLRRLYIVRRGVENLPDMNYFRKFFYTKIANKSYPFNHAIQGI